MRIVTVNVNGIRAALRKGMTDWLDTVNADVIALQEVRAPDEVVIEALPDWHTESVACQVKGRAGVALLSRTPLRDVVADAAVLGDSVGAPVHTGRWLEATVDSVAGPVRVVSVYVHSGQAGTTKMEEKYLHLEAMTARMQELREQYERVVVMGDINIAHTEHDIKNWKGNLTTAGFLPQERAYLDRWAEAGWIDVHRALVGVQDGPYTWWSMRGKAFDTNAGWRIDYQFASQALASAATQVRVDRQESWDARWSDHAPVVVDYALAN